MKKIAAAILLLLVLTTGAWAETARFPLYKLSPAAAMDLKCILGQDSIQIPVPERWEIKKARLSFSYANSTNLIAEISHISVKLNGIPVAQRKFNPLSPFGTIDVALPPELLPPGYNTLTFGAVQHYTRECESPCAPDLWTTINLNKAFIEFEYGLKPVPLKLSDVSGFLFDPKISPHGNVNIITENKTTENVTSAGIVAAGIARRFDYKKVSFTVSNGLKANVDNVLIGKKQFVEQFLAGLGIKPPAISGAYLRVMRLPSGAGKADAFHSLLIVSGKSNDDIKLAAETLTSMTAPFPGTDEITAFEFTLPEITLYGGRLVLTADKDYSFKMLNLATHTFEGFNPAPMDLSFRLPVDFLIKQNQYAAVSLNFTYGAGMRPDSVLNVLLNGKSVRAIHLKNTDGDLIEGYRVNIPTYLFKPGQNTISFVPVMAPQAKECDLLNTGNLFLTIFDNSTLHFPAMPHFVELPGIELFMLNGFPFTRWPDGFESMIYVTKPDEQTIAAALNLIALITQKNGYPVFGMPISVDKPKSWTGDLIVIGEAASIPDEFKKASPLKLTNPAVVPYPVIRSWEGEGSLAFSMQSGGLADDAGILSEFQSPYKKGKAVLMLTALTSAGVLRLSDALLEPAVQGAASKPGIDLVIVEFKEPDSKVTALSVGGKFTTGKLGNITRIDFYLSSYPYLYHASVGLVILIIGFALYYIIRRLRRRRQHDEKETPTKGS